MFDWLLNPIGSALAWIESWSGSYVIALLFYALIFKLLFSFFSVKQHKNQIKMAKLAPKMAIIREKYKGRYDQATMRKQNEEMMELQRSEGYNPLSGCLPLLIQLPIIIMLYSVIREPLTFLMKLDDSAILALYNYLEPIVHASSYSVESPFVALTALPNNFDQIGLLGMMREFVSTIHLGGAAEESAKLVLLDVVNGYYAASGSTVVLEAFPHIPNFYLWGMDLSQTPNLANFNLLVIIPVLAALSQWFTMFVMRKFQGNTQMLAAGGDNAQSQLSLKIMDLIMPLITLFIAFSFSAMLGVYWVIQSIFGIAQTVILHLAMPIPKYTEEEIKALRKAQRQAEKTQRNVIKTQPKYKSLHFIDDDDYDELPTINSESASNKNTAKSLSNQDKPEIKD